LTNTSLLLTLIIITVVLLVFDRLPARLGFATARIVQGLSILVHVLSLQR
jgi:hypothetical protein